MFTRTCTTPPTRLFSSMSEKGLEGVYAHFKDAVQDKVADAMQNVQGLTGQWSVDVLMDEREKFWLIDMAIAQRSAYWEMRPEGYAE